MVLGSRRFASFAALAVLLVAPSCGGNDASDVHDAFSTYQAAVLNRDGETATTCVDFKTLRHFAELHELAVHAGQFQIEKLPIPDRVLVLSLRHRVPSKQVFAMDGEGMFVHAVNEGWIGEAGAAGASLGAVEFEADIAYATVIAEGIAADARIEFRREQGEWKLDLRSMSALADDAYRSMIDTSGLEEEEFVLTLLEAVSGERVSERIWEPLEAFSG